MNEHQPLAAIRVQRIETAYLSPSRPIVVPHPEMDEFVHVLRELHGTDISNASRAARAFVETHHNWNTANERIVELLRE
jgi:hypothetical protein